MQGANAGNMQNRTPQQQQNMMGPNRTTQQPQNMMGPNRNQQQQPMGANNTMNNTQPNNMQNNMQNNQMQNNQMQNNMQGGMQNNMQGGMQNNMQQPGMGGPQQQNMMNQNMRGNMQQPPITTSQSTGLFGSSLFSGPANAAGSMFGGNRAPNPNQMQGQQQGQMGMGQQQGQMGMGQPGQQGPSMLGGLTSKLGDIASAAPGGDMLSKGKELIFMKFGLGGK